MSDKTTSHIGLSKEGIKIQYRTFLSDSAPGYLFILMFILGWYFPIFGVKFEYLFKYLSGNETINFPQEIKIYFLLLLLFLATPLGMTFNALSWFCFGEYFQKQEWYLLMNKNAVKSTNPNISSSFHVH